MAEITKQEITAPEKAKKKIKPGKFISRPLMSQTIKANLTFWMVMTIGLGIILAIINLVLNSKKIFTNINMTNVLIYFKDEDLQPLQILGLLETMGFSLNRIMVMSQIDLNALMSDLIYKIAGILLPLIYIIVTSNKLIAAQVDSGSLAYVLSTPTNRKKVIRTQYTFLVVSLILMFVAATIFGILSELGGYAINPDPKKVFPNSIRVILYCFGSFASVFGLAGICFGASAICNRSKNSIAIGGGICVFSFIATILGLFGNKVFVAVGVGVEAMNFFNYVSIFTLFDTEAMSNFAKFTIGAAGGSFDLSWLWKCGILIGLGLVTAFLGGLKFTKKDLPL